MRFHHTALTVQSLERSLAFYCGLLGFQVAERGEFEGTPLVFIQRDGACLELVEGGPAPEEGVVNHIAFAVEDLEQTLAWLKTAGVRILDPEPLAIYNGGRIAFTQGPDGELIEWMELR